MKKFLLSTVLLTGVMLCGEVPQKPVFKLLDMAHKKAPGENVLLSPFSMQECFGMVSCGAGKASAAELSSVLGLDDAGSLALREARKSIAASENAGFTSCNTLIIDRRLNFCQEFVNKAVYFYGGKVYKADFSRSADCVNFLNAKIKEQSNGLFEKVVDENDFSANPLAVLMNVLYFQSEWESPFEKEATQKQLFHASEKDKYQVDMMINSDYFPYYNDGKIHAVTLPYKNPRFRMIFLMPLDPAAPLSLITEMLANKGTAIIVAASSEKNETVVQIPRLELQADNDLKTLLKDAGMLHVFDPECGDLTKMVKDIPLFIDRARQVVKLKMDENGTEAAAVTIVSMPKAAAVKEVKQINNFHADRPFVMVLLDKETSAVILSAVICKPVTASAEAQQ
jgi:serpin B